MVRQEIKELTSALSSIHRKIKDWTPEEYLLMRRAMDDFITIKKKLAAIGWCEGDRVRFTGKYGRIVTGTVTKVNKVTLTVQSDGALRPDWKVSPALCQKLDV